MFCVVSLTKQFKTKPMNFKKLMMSTLLTAALFSTALIQAQSRHCSKRKIKEL